MIVPEKEHLAVVYEDTTRIPVDDGEPPCFKFHNVFLPFENEDSLKEWLEKEGAKVKHRVLRCIPQDVIRTVSYTFTDR